jgi:hypothetical protein
MLLSKSNSDATPRGGVVSIGFENHAKQQESRGARERTVRGAQRIRTEPSDDRAQARRDAWLRFVNGLLASGPSPQSAQGRSGNYCGCRQRRSAIAMLPSTPTTRRRPSMDGQVREEIDALQAVVGGLMAIAVVHRPQEAAAVVAAIRKEVPKRLRENPFLQKLLETLDAALSQGQ